MSQPGSADALALHQQIVNARPVPPGIHHDVTRPIPVTARVVWERDGAELVDTVALEWTRTVVRVRIEDRRHMVKGVWLVAGDVVRR